MLDLLPDLIDTHDYRYEAWLPQFHQPHIADTAEGLAMRRDVVTLLRFTQDNKVVGTQATGNMPLKMIRQVTPSFVDPPVLDPQHGDLVFKLRTEYEVWPLYFRHILAQVGGLLETPAGARWCVTPKGEAWLAADSATQVLHLLHTWWYRTNWLITWPVTGLGRYLPQDFEKVALARLLAIPIERRIDFATFADTLVQRTGLSWSSTDVTYHDEFLQSAIRKMVAQPGADLGVLALLTQDAGPAPLLPKLLAFRVTPFGRVLLTALSFPAPRES
jgi:hypothetical protein